MTINYNAVLTHSLTHARTYSITHSLIVIWHSINQSPNHSINVLLARSLTHWHSFIHSFIHSFVRSFVRSFIRSFVSSFVHSVDQLISLSMTRYLANQTIHLSSSTHNRFSNCYSCKVLAFYQSELRSGCGLFNRRLDWEVSMPIWPDLRWEIPGYRRSIQLSPGDRFSTGW